MRKSDGTVQGGFIWKRAPLGAGGWLRAGIGFSNAGDMITGGDTNGVYVRKAGLVGWRDFLDTSIMPTGLYDGTLPTSGDNVGAQVIAMAPSNGNVICFAFNGYVLRCLNALSATPIATIVGGLLTGAFTSNTNACLMWPRAVFDPQNPDVVLIGTQTGTLYYSTNFTQASPTLSTITDTVPGTYASSTAYHQVACDPSSTISGGIHQTWYIGTYGTGVTRSTTGPGGPYTLVSGSPANVRALEVDVSGNVYAINAGESVNGNLYKASATGAFSKCPNMANDEFSCVATNPQNALQVVVVTDGMAMEQSTDGGSTWLDAKERWFDTWPPPYGMSMSPQNLGWMQPRSSGGQSGSGFNKTFGGQGGQIKFHPTNGTLYCAGGQGMLKCVPPTHWAANDLTAVWQWQEDALNIEQFVVEDVFTPPGGKPIYACGDFCLLRVYDDTYAGTKSTIPQPGGSFDFDETAWTIENCPSNTDFLTAVVGFHRNANAYSTNAGDSWTCFSGSLPLAGSVIYGGGVILPKTTSDLFGWFIANTRPCSSHDGGASWAYEDVNMPGMKTTSRTYFGSGNGLLIVDSKTAWDTTQTYTIVLNTASGAGSVTVSGSTLTVTPASTGSSASAIAAQINASAANTMIQASFGGTGASSPGTGSNNLTFVSGWGWFPLIFNNPTRVACLDKTNGDIYAVNFGDDMLTVNASWAGIWKRDHASGTWSRIAGVPGGIYSPAVCHMREVTGQAGHLFFHGQTDVGAGATSGMWHTTDGWQTNAPVGDGTHLFTVRWAHTGKAAPGQTYPAIYINGTLNGVEGWYGCFDGSWTNWKLLSNKFCGGLIYGGYRFCAHPDIFGRVDVAGGGGGGFIGLLDHSLAAS